MEPKAQVTLWPIFLLELLSLVVWIPIAGLAGMGYSPQLNFVNVFLLIFHLYPAYILLAMAGSFLLKTSGKPRMALAVALLPPLLSMSGIGLLMAYAQYQSPRQTAAEAEQAAKILNEKCLEAGEQIFIKATGNIESMFIESQAPFSISRITNGRYEGGESAPDSFYGVVNSGYLKQYETAEKTTSPTGNVYRRFGLGAVTGESVASLESKYSLRFISKVNESEMLLGIYGGALEVVRIEDKSIMARSTYFHNRWSGEFCGHAEDGHFSSFLFLRRALDLKPIYKPAYSS